MLLVHSPSPCIQRKRTISTQIISLTHGHLSLLPPHLKPLHPPNTNQEIHILRMERLGDVLLHQSSILKLRLPEKGGGSHQRSHLELRESDERVQGPEELCVVLCGAVGLLC